MCLYSNFNEIVVETSSNMKHKTIIGNLLKWGSSVLLTGPSGNGKTLIANDLQKTLSQNTAKYSVHNICFTS